MSNDSAHIQTITPAHNITLTNKPIVELPEWDTARRLIFPYLEPIAPGLITSADVAARTTSDPLSDLLTNYIKMSLALFYRGTVIPLSEALIREWSISMATVRLAMESNMALVARTARFDQHEKNGIVYYSVHSDAAPFNSILPLYKPFRDITAEKLGSPFYLAVPERRTVLLFAKDALARYGAVFSDDIHLTYDTSTSFISPELLEVSEDGILTVCV